MKFRTALIVMILLISSPLQNELLAGGSTAGFNPLKNAYFGDLHIHTRYSFDAFIFQTRASPDDAYRYAKGEPLMHPAGYSIKLQGPPLDFMAVTDHAEYMGIVQAIADPNHVLSKLPIAERIRDSSRWAIWSAFREIGSDIYYGVPDKDIYKLGIMRSTWQRVIESANRHYQPGKFTTLIGYEFTSSPGYTLHRNVIFKSDKTPDLPFSSLMSQDPEDLWDWLDEQRENGIVALAIPHNSNLSNGNAFNYEQSTWSGDPFDRDYADQRMRNEPLVEVTQVKGTSETHPLLSPNDEWANFEIHQKKGSPKVSGSYVREAYLTGLTLQETKGFNPYRFGLIGSSDTHNAGAGYSESNYYSKIGVVDGTPERRGSVPRSNKKSWDTYRADPATAKWGASGLAGVWAEENTRESIFNALRRKETFATSGPRIRVRFFAGFDYEPSIIDDHDLVAKAYQRGVPMGGNLKARGKHAPHFLVWAIRDPNSNRLQRLQMIKGWVQDGKAHERVFDVACSDGLAPDPNTHRCPDNGAKVDLTDCSSSADKGDAELRTIWNDPTFTPGQRAIYYVRVLENPTCRWSTWDAIRAKVPPNPNLKKTIQERAWTSPIWYLPER
jgi:hypothetical protein